MPKIKNGNEIKRGGKAVEAYRERRAEVLEAVKNGASHKDVASMLGCGERTVEYMLSNNPEIETEIRKASMKSLAEVKNALYKRATGQCVRTVTTTGPKGSTVTTETLPPDLTAIKIYLTNYDPSFKAMTREEADMRKAEIKIKQDRLDNDTW